MMKNGRVMKRNIFCSMSRWPAFALACFLFLTSAVTNAQKYPFDVIKHKEGRINFLIAKNNGYAPVTVALQIDGNNIAFDKKTPVIKTVSPHASQEIIRIFAKDTKESYNFNYRYTYGIGDAFRSPDLNFPYRFPFADHVRSLVTQAPGGEMTTHTEPHDFYAIDFSMPEDTPVVAARRGTVIEVLDHFVEGGPDPRLLNQANKIRILHQDGTFADYAHLAPKKVLVRVGQQVFAGQYIGFSGNTGYSSGPHLHFCVIRAIIKPDGTVSQESVPVSFYAYEPPVRIWVEKGMTLEPVYDRP